MNWKTTIVLLILAGGCVALFWQGPALAPRLGLAPNPQAASDAGTAEVIAQLPVEKITRVEIQVPDQPKLELKAEAAGQSLELPGHWPIRRSEVEELIAALRDLKSRYYPIPVDDKTNLKQYGLADEQKPTIVTITDGTNSQKFLFGEAPLRVGENPFTRATYVRLEGKNEILRLGPHILPILRRNEDTYRRRQLFPEAVRERVADSKPPRPPGMEEPLAAVAPTFLLGNEAKEITIESPNGRLVLQRVADLPKPEVPADKPEGEKVIQPVKLAESWVIAEPVKDRADPEKLRAVLTALPNLWLEKFVEAPPGQDYFFGLGAHPNLAPQLFTLLGGSLPTGLGETPLRLGINLASLSEAKSASAKVTVMLRDGSQRTLQIGRVARTIGGDDLRYAKLEDNPLVFELKTDRLNDLQINLSRPSTPVSTAPVDELRDPTLVRFDPESVTGIEIASKTAGGDRRIVLKKAGDDWKILRPFREPSDKAEVAQLISQLGEMSARKGSIIDGAADLQPLLTVLGGLAKVDPAEFFGLKPDQAKKVTLTFERFKLSPAALDHIRTAQFPAALLVKLKAIQEKTFDSRDAVSEELTKLCGTPELEEELETWRSFILSHAKNEYFKITPMSLESLPDVKIPAAMLKKFAELGCVGDLDSIFRNLTDTAGGFSKLKSLQDREFETRDLFAAELAKLIGPNTSSSWGDALFDHFKEERFKFTPSSLDAMQKTRVPEAVLAKLERALQDRLLDKESEPRKQFSDDLAKILDKAELANWQSLILNQAKQLRHATLLVGKRAADGGKCAVMVEGWNRINLIEDRVEPGGTSHLDRQPSAYRAEKLFDRLKNKIGEIVVQRGATAQRSADSFTLREEPGKGVQWAITEPFKGEADTLTVGQIVGALSQLDAPKYVYDPRTDDPLNKVAQWPSFLYGLGGLASIIDVTGDAFFGLDKPALTLTLKFSEPKGAADVVIEIGRAKTPNEYFARRKGTSALFLVPAAVVHSADRKAEDLVDKTLLKFAGQPEVQTIRRTMNGQELEIAQNASALWDITKPSTAKADQTMIDDLAAQLSRLRAARIEAVNPKELKPEYGLKPPVAVVTVEALEKSKLAEKVLNVGNPVDPMKPDGDRFVQAQGSTMVAVIPGDLAKKLVAAPFKFRDLSLGGFVTADKIVVESSDRKATFAKSAGGWKMKEPLETAAEDEGLRELHDQLAKLRAEEFVEDKPKDLTKYGLDKPTHWRIYNGDKEVLHLLVGVREKLGPDMKTDGFRVYAKLEKGDPVVLLDPLLTSRLTAEYRKRDLWEPLPEKQLTEISIKSADGKDSLVLTRGPMGWIDPAKPTERLNSQLVNDLLLTLSDLRVEHFVVDKGADLKMYGLDKPRTLVVTAEGGKKHTVLLGNLFEGKRFYGKLDEPDRTDVFLLSEHDTRNLNRTRGDYAQKANEEPDVKKTEKK